MTPLQIFLAYTKIRGIMPKIHKLGIDGAKSFYEYDPASGKYIKKYALFKDIISNHFKNHGFGNTMFVSLLYQYPYGREILNIPEVNKAHKRWSTFVNKNIVVEGIKPGDSVKYKLWGRESEGKVFHIMNDFSRIQVEMGNGRIENVPPGGIIEVNDKPFEFSFYFKWKGKEYGKK